MIVAWNILFNMEIMEDPWCSMEEMVRWLNMEGI